MIIYSVFVLTIRRLLSLRDCEFCHSEKSVVMNFCSKCQTHFPIVGRINYKGCAKTIDEIETAEPEEPETLELSFSGHLYTASEIALADL